MILGERETLISTNSKHYDSIARIDGDLPIAHDVTKSLQKFTNKIGDDSYEARRIASFDLLRQRTSAICYEILQFIEDHPLITVVETEKNYHQASGLYLFCWERSLEITDRTTLAVLSERSLALEGSQTGLEVPFLTISQAANTALDNLAKTLKGEENARHLETIQRQKQREYDEMICRMRQEKKVKAKAEEKNYIHSQLGCTLTEQEKSDYLEWFRKKPWNKRSEESWKAFFMCKDPDAMTPKEYEQYKIFGNHYKKGIPGDYYHNHMLERFEHMRKIDSRKGCFDDVCIIL